MTVHPLRPVNDPVIVDRDDAAEALTGWFLSNADAGDHDANDALIQEMGRRRRGHPDTP